MHMKKANFVSQCIHAGGISTISGTYNIGWYYTTPPVSSMALPAYGNTGSNAWIQVAAFDTFWRNQEISRKQYGLSLYNISDYEILLLLMLKVDIK